MLVDDRDVRVTNPDRVLVDGVTKADALRSFLAVGDGILAALRDRPVMLERRRDGDVSLQRRVPQGAPDWVSTVRGPEYELVCGLDGSPQTSGGRGLHIIAPIEPRPGRAVQDAREAIGREVVARAPELATLKRLKRDRRARVHVDCGPQTVASAYSIRPGGLVSAPVGWEELDHVRPEDFTTDRLSA